MHGDIVGFYKILRRVGRYARKKCTAADDSLGLPEQRTGWGGNYFALKKAGVEGEESADFLFGI